MSAINTSGDQETEQLTAWLKSVLGSDQLQGVATDKLDIDNLCLRRLSGDASARRYFYINKLDSCLAVFAPPQSEDSNTFVQIADFLRQQGVRAPHVYAADFEQGTLLIENLGERLLLPELNSDSVETLYGEALMNLLNMQNSTPPKGLLPPYDEERLLQEMQLFPRWFVQELLGYTLSGKEEQLLNEVFSTLIASALEQPQVFVHRDYHSRNLIIGDVGPPGVIDFQDAVLGPITYDVVSLLKDCYVRWPASDVERWLMVYAGMAIEMGLLPKMPKDTLLRWFDWMGLQRHIKVLGIFARLYLRDNKPNYLHDLPLVIRYTLEAAQKYPEMQNFCQWFQQKLSPLIQQQSWYTDYSMAGE